MSDVMASSSNVLYVALSKNVSKLDIGGLAVTMISLLRSESFISKMKQEYIKKEYEAIVMGKREKENGIW